MTRAYVVRTSCQRSKYVPSVSQCTASTETDTVIRAGDGTSGALPVHRSASRSCPDLPDTDCRRSWRDGESSRTCDRAGVSQGEYRSTFVLEEAGEEANSTSDVARMDSPSWATQIQSGLYNLGPL